MGRASGCLTGLGARRLLAVLGGHCSRPLIPPHQPLIRLASQASGLVLPLGCSGTKVCSLQENGKGWGLLKGIDTNSGQTGWEQHPRACTQTKEHAWGCRDNKGLKSQLEAGTSLWLMGRRAATGPLG